MKKKKQEEHVCMYMSVHIHICVCVNVLTMFVCNKIHGICMAPHTPSTEAIDVSVGSANGIQGARHIDIPFV